MVFTAGVRVAQRDAAARMGLPAPVGLVGDPDPAVPHHVHPAQPPGVGVTMTVGIGVEQPPQDGVGAGPGRELTALEAERDEPKRSGRVLAALSAGAGDGEALTCGYEPEPVFECRGQRAQDVLGHLGHSSARPADEVVVDVVDGMVDGSSLTEVDPCDHLEGLEGVEGAIHRRQVDVGVVRPHGVGDVLGGEVVVSSGEECGHDRPSSGGDSAAVSSEHLQDRVYLLVDVGVGVMRMVMHRMGARHDSLMVPDICGSRICGERLAHASRSQ